MLLSPGEVLLLDESLPGMPQGAYVLLSVQSGYAHLCLVGEDAQGALCTTDTCVNIDIRDLSALRRLNHILSDVAKQEDEQHGSPSQREPLRGGKTRRRSL
jgi:hypothetical protein